MSPGTAPSNDEEGGARPERSCDKVELNVEERGRIFLDASLKLAKESDRDPHRRPKLFPRCRRENA